MDVFGSPSPLGTGLRGRGTSGGYFRGRNLRGRLRGLAGSEVFSACKCNALGLERELGDGKLRCGISAAAGISSARGAVVLSWCFVGRSAPGGTAVMASCAAPRLLALAATERGGPRGGTERGDREGGWRGRKKDGPYQYGRLASVAAIGEECEANEWPFGLRRLADVASGAGVLSGRRH